VLLKDGANNDHTATTGANGAFKITGSAAKPIVPGTLTLGANREGFESGTLTRDGQAGRSVTGLRLGLKPAASAAPSAPAAVDPSAPSVEPSTADLAAPSNRSNESGTNWLSLLLIGMGVLLVLLGVGAIVLLLMRRKDDRDEPGEDYDDDPRQTRLTPAGAVAGARGAYLGGPGGDATMVAPGNMNDATAIVPPARQQLDEYPDPYAAAPTRPGYGYGGAAEPTYGGVGAGAASGGYRGERGYAAEEPPAGRYAPEPRAGRYADEPRPGRYADEPTGRFASGYPAAGTYPGSPAGGGYGGADNGAGYRGEGGGYSGYQGESGADDYGRRGGHAAEPVDPPYEPRRGGYPPAEGYDRPRAGGYAPEQRGQYEPPARHDAPGRYDTGGRPNGRGRVDWLDD
jgi:hypothetical protein